MSPSRDEIRQLCEEARRRAAEDVGAVELPPRHWQEAAEDRPGAAIACDPAPVALSLDFGELAAREGCCARLRALLADGQWHSALELVDVAGLRYGGRLFELRRGSDGGPPLDVESESRPEHGRRVWFYRAAQQQRETGAK